MRQGSAPGKLPTSTEIEFIFFRGVYTNAYSSRLNKERPALTQLNQAHINKIPATPEITAKVQASFGVIRPEATGLCAVRFINASVSFSTVWLMALAEPVINIPAINNKNTDAKSNCTLGARR